jgi:hypothetical protein
MKARALRRGNWSVQELERLRQLLPRRGVLDTATLLRRSAESVQRKAAALLRVPLRRGDWTASDEAVLRESWGAVDLRLLATMLGRQPADVRKRAVELRTRLRAGPWRRDEQQRLKELYGTRRDADLEVCLQRTIADIDAMAATLCLAKDKHFAAREATREAVRAAASGVFAGAAPPRMPRWTTAEVERLCTLYADRDNLAVARLLGRSVTSVANKANQIGLKKSLGVLATIGRTNVEVRYRAAGVTGAAES